MVSSAGEQQPGLEVGEGCYNTADWRPQTSINFLRCPGKCISRVGPYISQTPVTICPECSETQQRAYRVWMGLKPRRKLTDPFLGFLNISQINKHTTGFVNSIIGWAKQNKIKSKTLCSMYMLQMWHKSKAKPNEKKTSRKRKRLLTAVTGSDPSFVWSTNNFNRRGVFAHRWTGVIAFWFQILTLPS